MKRLLRHAAGFTLVELLTVIAIVAVLAALLLPALALAPERGRRAACAAHLRQLALAAISYADDNDDRLPRAAPGSQPPSDPIYLPLIGTNTHAALLRHLGSTGVLDCPNLRPAFAREMDPDWRWPLQRSELQIGYFYLGGRAETPWPDLVPPVREAWISPQTTRAGPEHVLFADLSYVAPCVSRVVIPHGHRGAVARTDQAYFNSGQTIALVKDAVIAGSQHARLDGAVIWVNRSKVQWHRAVREFAPGDNSTCMALW